MYRLNSRYYLIIIVVVFITIFYFGFKSHIKNTTKTFIENNNISLPVRLKIPKISVGANIEYVGLTPNGAMDVPKDPAEVAWFNLGPKPGELGSAVIDGHSGWRDNIPAVFDNLYKLNKGDKIYIIDGSGVTTTFVVREIRNYDPKANVPDVFISHDDKAHLNLITCAGLWDNVVKSHSERLVVFTDKES